MKSFTENEDNNKNSSTLGSNDTAISQVEMTRDKKDNTKLLPLNDADQSKAATTPEDDKSRFDTDDRPVSLSPIGPTMTTTTPTGDVIEMAATIKSPVEAFDAPPSGDNKETPPQISIETTNASPLLASSTEVPLNLQKSLHATAGPAIELEAISLSDDLATAQAKLLNLMDYIDEVNCIYSPLHKQRLRKSIEDVILSFDLSFGSRLRLFDRTLYSANFMPERTEQSKVEMLCKIFKAVADPAHHAGPLKSHITSKLPAYPAYSSLFYKCLAGLEFIVGLVCFTASYILGLLTFVALVGIPPAITLAMHSYVTWRKSTIAAEKQKLKKMNVFFDEYLTNDYDKAKQRLFATLGLSYFAEDKGHTDIKAVDAIETLKETPSFQQQIQKLIQEFDKSVLAPQEKTKLLNILNDTLADPLNNAPQFNSYVAKFRKKHYSSPGIARLTACIAVVASMVIGGLSFAFIWTGWGALGFIPTAGLIKLAHHQSKKEDLALATISLKKINKTIQNNMPQPTLRRK